MYAIIQTGGKQYSVEPGQRVRVEKLEGEIGGQIELDQVLLIGADDGVTVGRPTVTGAKVTGTIVNHGRLSKLIVYKFRRRKNYRRKQGHRQSFTEIEVKDIIRSA
jgi:large subunit ribosomal protein L21